MPHVLPTKSYGTTPNQELLNITCWQATNVAEDGDSFHEPSTWGIHEKLTDPALIECTNAWKFYQRERKFLLHTIFKVEFKFQIFIFKRRKSQHSEKGEFIFVSIRKKIDENFSS